MAHGVLANGDRPKLLPTFCHRMPHFLWCRTPVTLATGTLPMLRTSSSLTNPPPCTASCNPPVHRRSCSNSRRFHKPASTAAAEKPQGFNSPLLLVSATWVRSSTPPDYSPTSPTPCR